MVLNLSPLEASLLLVACGAYGGMFEQARLHRGLKYALGLCFWMALFHLVAGGLIYWVYS